MSVWLCQIAKHTYYNHLKKEKRYNYTSIDNLTELGVDIQSDVDSPEVELIKQDTLMSIHNEIQLLSEPYREIFLLRNSLNLSFREIGEIFGKSENWARVTYYRAKLKLAERVKGDEYEL